MKGLVIRLTPTLLFGPPPKTRDDLKFLIKERGVTLILNTCALTNERTKSGVDRAEFYMQLLKPKERDNKRYHNDEVEEEEEDNEELFVSMKRVALNLFEFEAQGRTKDLQEQSLARYYVAHARLLQKEVEEANKKLRNPLQKHVVYIHNGSGIMEEAYLAFALWDDAPKDVLQWIKDNHYEWLFDDDNDKKHMLTLVLDEVKRGERKLNFFKKAKQ